MIRDLKIVCDLCKRGVVHNDEWGAPCDVCDGRGSMSLESFCEKIGECETTLRRLLAHRRVRVRTAVRILDKVLGLYTKPSTKQQVEMFA